MHGFLKSACCLKNRVLWGFAIKACHSLTNPSLKTIFTSSLFLHTPTLFFRAKDCFVPHNTTMDFVVSRRPCFVEEDDGLASLADMEAGVSGNHQQNNYAFFSRPLSYGRRNSLRNLSSLSSSSVCSSPRSGPKFYDARFEEPQPHFLEACFLCKKPLGNNRDIFMYRGDTPFCSEECRQEQIEADEAKEKNWNLSSSMKSLRNKDEKKSLSPTKNQDYSCRTGTVAAA